MNQSKNEPTPKIKQPDLFLNLKHIGYCWSQNSLESTYKDYVRYAQFQLCVLNKKLMKDPIWDDYTEEEILAEYYAHCCRLDEDFKKEIELRLAASEIIDFSDWADLQMKKTREEADAKIIGQADRVEFQPEDVMGDS